MTTMQWHAAERRPRQHRGVLALGEAWDHAVGRLGEWRRRSRERGELAALDDRMLKDIGLTRADAEFLSNKPFWRE